MRAADRVRAELALGKQGDLGAVALLPRGLLEQFDERALAHHHLARERVGLGQQARAVDEQRDLARRGQVHQPALQVVRMRREQRVRQGPAARIGFVARAAPGCNGFVGQRIATARQTRDGGGDGAATREAKKGTALHDRLLVAVDGGIVESPVLNTH
jgi:hypothetical protein